MKVGVVRGGVIGDVVFSLSGCMRGYVKDVI